MKQQQGFTLIELVIVIVILGILAAVAVPKFVDLSSEAEEAAFDGVIGAMNSAMSINFAGCAVVRHKETVNKCVAVKDCTDVLKLLTTGLPNGYVVSEAEVGTNNGDTAVCTVIQTETSKKSFQAIRAGT